MKAVSIPIESTDLELHARAWRAAEPGAGPGGAGVTFIRPARRWQLINARELWHYRELVGFLAWRDVKVRYKQTLLGATWAILQPVLMMVVFTLFFSRMAGASSGEIPYPLFVYAGLLPWTFFSTAVTGAGNSIIGSERLISKIYFPRLAIPFAAVGAAIVDFVIACGLLVVLMFAYGVRPGVGMLLLPVIFLPIALTAMGIGTLLAALNVSYRDFRYVIPFLIQLWMFATPTIYMQATERISRPGDAASTAAAPSIPEGATSGAGTAGQSEVRSADTMSRVLLAALALNPMTSLIGAFRAAALGTPIPWMGLGVSSIGALTALLLGCLYFRKVEDHLADVL